MSIVLALPANAQWVDYTPADTYREAVYEALLFADYKQTSDIRNHFVVLPEDHPAPHYVPAIQQGVRGLRADNSHSYSTQYPSVYEVNPMLGHYPTQRKIDNYFLASAILHPTLTGFVPLKYRGYWQYGGIVLEAAVIIHNKRIGLKIDF